MRKEGDVPLSVAMNTNVCNVEADRRICLGNGDVLYVWLSPTSAGVPPAGGVAGADAWRSGAEQI